MHKERETKGLDTFEVVFRGLVDKPTDFKELYMLLRGGMPHILNLIKEAKEEPEKLVALSNFVMLAAYFELRVKQPNMTDFEFFKDIWSTISIEKMAFNKIRKSIKEQDG